MPLEPVDALGAFTGTGELPRPDAFDTSAPLMAGEEVPAAFRTENTIGSIIASKSGGFSQAPLDPGFDPWAEIADTPYEAYPEQFARAANKGHLDAIKADIDRENKDRDTLARSGMAGIGASLGAGFFDLPTLLPGGTIARTAKGGVSLARTAGVTALAGAGAGAASEVVLQATQQRRTAEESAMVIGGSAVLAGLLGAGIGKLVSRAELNALAPRVEQDFTLPRDGEPDPFLPAQMRPSVETAPGASDKSRAVADAIRESVELMALPPEIRVRVTDTLGPVGDDGQFSLRAANMADVSFTGTTARARAVGDDGNEIGFVSGTVKDGVLIVDKTTLPETHQGKGYGVAMYRALIDAALDRGLRVESAYEVSEKASRVYDALARRGYKVERAPYRIEKKSGGRRIVVTDDLTRRPIAVTGKPEGSPPAGLYSLRAKRYAAPEIETPDQIGDALKTIRESVEDAQTAPLKGRFSPDDLRSRFIAYKKADTDLRAALIGGLDPEDALARYAKLRGEAEAIVNDLRKTDARINRDIEKDMKAREGKGGEGEMFSLRAFHGSPHEFDRFDLSRIGDGEGAQVFGHGLYFAENPEVAKSYQRMVFAGPVDPASAELGMRNFLMNAQGDVARARQMVRDEIRDARHPETKAHYEAIAREFDKPRGNLYEVDVDVEPHQLLDWDKPLSEQSDHVKGVVKELYGEETFNDPRFQAWTGAKLYERLGGSLADGAAPRFWGELASKELVEWGIPGIRYLDQGSRDAGDGTRNIVVFDDSLIKITKKNGEAVTAAERQDAVDAMFGVRQTPEGLIAEGHFDPNELLITIAADALDPLKTLKHEGIHALKTMGLFTGKEWSTLEAAAKKGGWLETHNVRGLYEGVYGGREDTGAKVAPAPTQARAPEPAAPAEVTPPPPSAGGAVRKIVEPRAGAPAIRSVDDFTSAVASLKSELGIKTKPRRKEEKFSLRQLSDRAQALNAQIDEMSGKSILRQSAEGIRRFKFDVERIIGVAEQHVNIDAEGMPPAAKEGFLDALHDLGQIIDNRLGRGYDLVERLDRTESAIKERLYEFDSKFDDLESDAVSIRERIDSVQEDITARLEEIDEAAGRIAADDEEIDEATFQAIMARSVAVTRATMPDYAGRPDATFIDILKEDFDRLTTLVKTLDDEATSIEAKNLDDLDRDALEELSGADATQRDARTVEVQAQVWREQIDQRLNDVHGIISDIKEQLLDPDLNRLQSIADDIEDRFYQLGALERSPFQYDDDGYRVTALPTTKKFSLRGEGKAASGPVDPKLEAQLLEEAIAEQFSLWRQGAIQVKGALAKLFERIQQFLERTGNALRGRGFQTADDVFAAVRSGEVGSRAPGASPSAAGAIPAAGLGRATSAGASAVERADDTLKSALGLEKAFYWQDPMLRLQTSRSAASKRHVQELAETPLAYDKNELGEPTAPGGSQMGAPGAVETRMKFWQGALADAVQAVDNGFLKYRTGHAKRFTGETVLLNMRDTVYGTDALTYPQFKQEIAKALRRGDEHQIPEVAGAARIWRQKVLDPLKDEAIEHEMLPEGVTPETAPSYLNRLYNKDRIIAERDQFKTIVADWLEGQETINRGVRSRLGDLLTRHDDAETAVAKLEAKIAKREPRLRELEKMGEEVNRFNQFAMKRSMARSEPIDTIRTEIAQISTRAATQLQALEALTTEIRAQKDLIPGLLDAERRMQRLSRGMSDIRSRAELIDEVDDAAEIDEGISALNEGVREVMARFRAEGRQLREESEVGEVLRGLERERAALARRVRPFRQRLQTLRREQRGLEKRARPKAAEASVFMNRMRGRTNTLQDQISGRRGELDTLRFDLEAGQARLATAQKAIEDEVVKYQGKTAKEAQSALKARASAAETRPEGAARLRSADKPVMLAGRKIAAQLDKEPGEITDLADEIIDRILGTPDGRLPYDAHQNSTTMHGASVDARGPLAARQFMIPDAAIERYLENDIEVLGRAYTRTMAADVEITKRFGSVDMKQQLKEIADDYAKLSAKAKTPKERKKLHKQRDNDIRDLAAIRDRLRGTYNIPSNPDGMMVRSGRVINSLNYMRMLGGMTISAIPDTARTVMVHGLMRTAGDGLLPLLRNWSGARLAMTEVKLAGTALDMVLDSRAMQIADVMDDFGRHSKFERAIQTGARNFGVISLMAPWNAAMKQFSGLVTMTRMLRATERIAAGKGRPKEVAMLAAGGISESNARKIAEQFAKHGKKEAGVWHANTAAWEERSAIEAFRAALVRDVDRIIVTPGQERPLWMSTETGRLIGQFKSFSISAMQRVLISGLQQKDMATLNGAIMMIALGGIATITRAKVSGQPVPDLSDRQKQAQFLVESIDRSGLTGWLMEANSMTEKLTRGAVGLSALTGKPVSRYASRNITGSLLGPTAGTMEDFTRVVGAAASGEWNQSDSRVMRRLIPYNNIFYLRQMFDQAEAGINGFFGVPKPASARR